MQGAKKKIKNKEKKRNREGYRTFHTIITL